MTGFTKQLKEVFENYPSKVFHQKVVKKIVKRTESRNKKNVEKMLNNMPLVAKVLFNVDIALGVSIDCAGEAPSFIFKMFAGESLTGGKEATLTDSMRERMIFLKSSVVENKQNRASYLAVYIMLIQEIIKHFWELLTTVSKTISAIINQI